MDALRRTRAGSALVGTLTAAPDLDGWTVVERLIADLAPLQDLNYLVIDDVHELDPERCNNCNCSSCGRRLSCVSCWPRGTTCAWACTDCGWKANSPRSAIRICGSPWPKPRSCSERRGWRCPGLRLQCCTSGPRAGQRGCGWPRCPWRGTRTRTSGWRPSSPAVNGRWPSTCWPRCWIGRASRCESCCCAPASWSGSTASSRTC
ncbi:hypothetical protein E4K10_04635 [Streptomyces sp. T1317-0309]|nr:hypothetical protein E4K10_04635 [Streptomyces sp. T1317-0309]